MTSGLAPAKLNLALVVGPRRDDGKHEVVTVLQHIDLVDRISVVPATALVVAGFDGDTIVTEALRRLAAASGVEPAFAVEIAKSIPVAAGLGGGSADAAIALRLANDLLPAPLEPEALAAIAAGVGADVPFFLEQGPRLGTGDGSTLSALTIPQEFWALLVLPDGVVKDSTASIYEDFDRRSGESGFAERSATLVRSLADLESLSDLATLPPNDLASSPLAQDLLELGALRADVSGAGPCVYALFATRADAETAEHSFRKHGRTWIAAPFTAGRATTTQ